MTDTPLPLISYIAPAAPATRRPAEGDELSVRPEIGFTPAWFRQHLEIDFGRRYHTDPAYRRSSVLAMREELRRRFGGTSIGRIDQPDSPQDLLTGLFGACSVAAIYGAQIVYSQDRWPDCSPRYLESEEIDRLEPPDLGADPFFQRLMTQVDWIADQEGRVEGYVNWQGVLNNAQRLRGPELFIDMLEHPSRARRLFDCVSTTMIDAARRLHARQRETGVEVRFLTVSNCLVNMVSPEQYAELLLDFDRRIADAFDGFGVHNCAWTADPYLEHYASLPRVGYIDMGRHSDLRRARDTFPNARRAVMITPMEAADRPLNEIRRELGRIANQYGPCDIVAADIEAGTPDSRVLAIVEICEELSRASLPRS